MRHGVAQLLSWCVDHKSQDKSSAQNKSWDLSLATVTPALRLKRLDTVYYQSWTQQPLETGGFLTA